MNKIIDETLDYVIPSGMREMTEEEHQKYFSLSKEENVGFRNEEKHTILAITYKKRPLVLGRLASFDAFLKATEKNIQKMVPTYESVGHSQKSVDGREIKTFSFRYLAQESNQFAEYDLHMASMYTCSFEVIAQEEYRDYAQQKLNELLASVHFKI